MNNLTNPALMACIRAIVEAHQRLDEKMLNIDNFDNIEINDLGNYNIDLSNAYDELVEEYNSRRSTDSSLPPLEEYLYYCKNRK